MHFNRTHHLGETPQAGDFSPTAFGDSRSPSVAVASGLEHLLVGDRVRQAPDAQPAFTSTYRVGLGGRI